MARGVFFTALLLAACAGPSGGDGGVCDVGMTCADACGPEPSSGEGETLTFVRSAWRDCLARCDDGTAGRAPACACCRAALYGWSGGCDAAECTSVALEPGPDDCAAECR